jgi:HlyD family secretion protein
MKRPLAAALVAAAVVVAAVVGGWYWWQQHQSRLPEHVAAGNGRIEAEEIHVATKNGGRVVEVAVDEGDLVERGQVLARMDTAELDASLARAEAEVARAHESVAAARATVVQRESELIFAEQELRRALLLLERGNVAQQRVDQMQSQRDAAHAALDAAKAQLTSAERAVDAAEAEARRIRTQIDDAVLVAPEGGRVLYRLAEPGEVLGAGGRVVTLLNLTDVHMTIFLPTAEAGRVLIGNEARIVLDAYPQYVIPARVTFVSPEAQFTPREVETRSERDKLMFRVKVSVPAELLLQHLDKVRTGLPGEAYVLLGTATEWPERLAVKLP